MKKLFAAALILHAAAFARERAPLRPVRTKVVADFSRRAHLKSVVASGGVLVSLKGATIEIPARKASEIIIWQSEGADPSAFDELRLEIVAPEGDRRVPVTWKLSDAKGAAPGTFVLDGGANEIRIPLRDLYIAGGGRALDAKSLRALALSFGRMSEGYSFTLGKLSLVRLWKSDVRMRTFDFGPAASVRPGAVPVTPELAYDDARGYGLTAAEGLQAKALLGELPLLGDGVQGAEVGFAAKLPDGKYEVRAVAFHLTWNSSRDNSNYSIEAQGKEAVRTDLDLEKFLSFDHHYYGADIFFDPRKPVFEQYFSRYFKPHAFEVEVTDGKLELTFRDCTVFAVSVWPKASEGDRAHAALYDGVAYDLWKRGLRYRPHAQDGTSAAPSREDRRRGYSVFSRGLQKKIFPEDAPLEGESIGGLELACAPGEYEGVNFAVRPLKDLGILKIELTDLAGPGGAAIPASAMDLRLVKEHLQRAGGPYHEAVPTLLVPYRDIDAFAGWNRQYWITLHAPDGAVAGAYTGKVLIKPAKGRATELPVSVTVRPFGLAKADASFTMWNNGAASAHQYRAHGGSPEVKKKLIDAMVDDMAAHGMTAYEFGDAHPQKLENGLPVIDYSTHDLIAEAMKRNGMDQESCISVMGSVNYRLMKWGLKEFGPKFNVAYRDMIRQHVAWAKRQGLRMLIFVTDEPRETNLNAWNRNRVDCIKYLKMCREVPGARTTITLMADRDHFGDDYTVMIPLMDVTMNHCWERAKQTMFLCIKEKLSGFIGYNNGWSRYVWGVYVWSARTGGNWQWVYNWEIAHAHLPLFFSTETSAAFAYPGGYVPTIKYEWVREGIDDYRYLRTLDAAMKSKPNSPAAKAAASFLKRLKKYLPQYPKTGLRSGADAGGASPGELSSYCAAWREQVAEFIDAINSGRDAKMIPDATAMFPAALEAFEKVYTARIVKEAPKLDGVLDDAVWKKAPVATGFVSIPRAEKARADTEVKIVTDGEWLYFAFHNIEPLYGELKAYAINRDDACWQDDAVEVFLDTNLDRKTYYQAIVNNLGTIQDSDTRDGLWNGEIRTAPRKGKGFWDVEIAVKLSSIKAAPKAGEVWGMNLCRDRGAGKEVSSWAFVGTGFHNPGKFGKLKFVSE